MVANIVHDILECYILECQIPITRKGGHIYLEWDESQKLLYTYAELRKFHKNVLHYRSYKLFTLLKLARAWETNQEIKNILKAVPCRCDACQKFPKEPVRFRVSLLTEENLVFGYEPSIDIVFL